MIVNKSAIAINLFKMHRPTAGGGAGRSRIKLYFGLFFAPVPLPYQRPRHRSMQSVYGHTQHRTQLQD